MTSASLERRYPVSAEDRGEVIDAVNRLNMAFDEWDIETMVAAFTEDGVVHHARGDLVGYDALRRFYDAYRPSTLGERRNAVNHVVDGLPDCRIRVTSYNLLIRVGHSRDDAALRRDMVTEYDDLPGISVHAVMIDTFRKDEGFGWRICHRSADRNAVNRVLHDQRS